MSHALLSPSSASRWLACTPSARLEQQYPDTTSEAAKEGTLAHAVAEVLLHKFTGVLTDDEAQSILDKYQVSEHYTADLLSHAMDYVTYVIEQYNFADQRTMGTAILDIEKRIDLTMYVKEGFGTGDAIIIADHTLHIIDLKYGKGVQVSCTNNKQMMLYGLGALHEYGLMYDIDYVRMTIYQPRLGNISSWEIDAEELLAWGETELVQKAALAYEGQGRFQPGDHCRFCKARGNCRALAEEQLTLAAYEFRNPAVLNEHEIAEILAKADAFTNWIKAVEDYAFGQAMEGNMIPGYKLVEGRSNRVYADPEAVAQRLIAANFPEEQIFSKSLLGITALEKLVTKKVFEGLLSDLIVKPAGKPTLVPEADKRPAWSNAASAVNDFK